MGTHILIDIHPYEEYHIFMKTTVELSDALMIEVKQTAKNQGTTMREVIEAALRTYLDKQNRKEQKFRYKNHSFKGNGVCEGIEEGAWETIRGRIYEGRGG
jgi:Arc/MetJ family transcription regulator